MRQRQLRVLVDKVCDMLNADIEAHLEQWSMGMSEALISLNVERVAVALIRDLYNMTIGDTANARIPTNPRSDRGGEKRDGKVTRLRPRHPPR